MSSPVPASVVNVPDTVPDDSGPDHIDPATSTKVGSIMYDRQEGGFNLEWESRANFHEWLKHEQAALGIEIQLSKTRHANTPLYSTCETFSCARNGTGGKSNYVKKTDRERKIESKRIKGGCPCYVWIKTYSHTKTVLGKYNLNHSHPIGKDNLKYIRIRACTRELIESWVYYGVTDSLFISSTARVADFKL